MNSLSFFAGFAGLGTTELVIILLIVVLLFGATKLPGLARGIGQSIKEFKKASNGEEEQPKSAANVPNETKKAGLIKGHDSN